MSSTTTYLITGANRGLGKGLVATYLSRPNNIVIAAVRDPGSSTAKALSSLPCDKSGKLIVIKIDSESHGDPAAAIKLLQTTYKINSLDVVLANAGIQEDLNPVETASISVLEKHIAVNSIAPLALFQAVFPLLKEAPSPKFMIMGSAMGSIAGMDERAAYPMYSYGASKALANYTVRKIHFTHENIISFALDPGFAQTEMGNAGARAIGMEKAFTEVDDCVTGLASVIDGATREKTSGHFPSWDGGEFRW